MSTHDTGFPPGFFDRYDEDDDAGFYAAPRFVTHLDDGAIAAVVALYAELGIGGWSAVLDLCSSWVSHLPTAPAELVVLGLNAAELAANPMATDRVVQDLNVEPSLPFADDRFDAVLCCVSIDYLVRPVSVLAEARRVLRPGGVVVLTFSNRCFPSKAVRAWLETDDAGHVAIVEDYLRRAGFAEPTASVRVAPGRRSDPLYAVVGAARGGGTPAGEPTDRGKTRAADPNG